MFFKDIASWSKKKVFWMNVLFSAIYMVFMLLFPIAIIINKYGIGQKTEKDTILTGWSLILIIFVLVVGIFALMKVLRKLPDETRKQQIFKYTLELIKDLILPVSGYLILSCFKSNFDLACTTASLCLISMIIGIMVDDLVLKYLDKELSFNKEIDHNAEIKKRSHRMDV